MNWFAFGITHREADLSWRKNFALDELDKEELYSRIFQETESRGFVLCTCNRTSVLVRTNQPDELERRFSALCGVDSVLFRLHSYRFYGEQAIRHFYEIGAGLDSKIPGDFEIIGQMKKAYLEARKTGGARGEGMMEKLMNSVIRSSRRIKNETAFSNGTASVSYAAVRSLKDHLKDFQQAKVLLIGTGKIGLRTVENLVKHKKPATIYLCNRTNHKAESAAERMGLQFISFESLSDRINEFDAVVSSTSAGEYLIRAEHLTSTAPELLIDLSVPANIHPEVALLEHSRLFNVDQLSEVINDNVGQRMASAPLARKIVEEEMADFLSWKRTRDSRPEIDRLSDLLIKELHGAEMEEGKKERLVKKWRSQLFIKVKEDEELPGEQAVSSALINVLEGEED